MFAATPGRSLRPVDLEVVGYRPRCAEAVSYSLESQFCMCLLNLTFSDVTSGAPSQPQWKHLLQIRNFFSSPHLLSENRLASTPLAWGCQQLSGHCMEPET